MGSAISTILVSGEPRPGEIRKLRVTEAHDYDLVGELVDTPEHSYVSPKRELSPFPILPSVTPRTALPAR